MKKQKRYDYVRALDRATWNGDWVRHDAEKRVRVVLRRLVREAITRSRAKGYFYSKDAADRIAKEMVP